MKEFTDKQLKDLPKFLEVYLKITYPCTVTLSYDSKINYLIINKIEIDLLRRKEGYGTKIINFIIKLCKEEEINLALTASNQFGTPSIFLKSWYKKLGFKENKGSNKDFSIKEQFILQY